MLRLSARLSSWWIRDAQLQGLRDGTELDRLPIDKNFASGRRFDAGDNPHERARAAPFSPTTASTSPEFQCKRNVRAARTPLVLAEPALPAVDEEP